MVSTTSVEHKEQGSTRHHILQLLRRQGQMTALELSEALHIGAVGVRQHLALLERDGLVCVASLRRGVGRPSHLYILTEEAERCFPKNYDQLALDMINFIAEQGGEEAVNKAFESRRTALVQKFAPRLVGKSRAEQMVTLTEILFENGYMSECEQLEDGSFILIEHNCPIDCVARRYPQICDHEMILYQELLGAPIERDSTIAQSDVCCRYRIPA